MEIGAAAKAVDYSNRIINLQPSTGAPPAEDSLREGDSNQTVQQMKQADKAGEKLPASDEQKIKALERLFKLMAGNSTYLQYSVHEPTNSIMVKIVDKDSGDILKEIPSHKILDMVAKICEMAGIMVDKRV